MNEALYIHSIIYAAERSECGFRDFDAALEQDLEPPIVFGFIQEALTHAGGLSRFFWPVEKENALAKARGVRLRKAFALTDASPLKWRRLRNAFEHIDADLDQFLLENNVGSFFPTPLIDDHALADEQIGKIFKLVDPEAKVCVVLGKKFEFQPIRDEVRRVLSMVHKMDENGGRLT